MVMITAIIRARSDAQNIVRDSLLSVVEAVRETEPQTTSYFIGQSADDHAYSRRSNALPIKEPWKKHSSSPAMVRLLLETRSHLDGDVVIHVGQEIASK